MTITEAYGWYNQASENLRRRLAMDGAKISCDYYRSQARPIDEASRQRVYAVASEIQLVANPKGKQKRYSAKEKQAKMVEWGEKLWKAFEPNEDTKKD